MALHSFPSVGLQAQVLLHTSIRQGCPKQAALARASGRFAQTRCSRSQGRSQGEFSGKCQLYSCHDVTLSHHRKLVNQPMILSGGLLSAGTSAKAASPFHDLLATDPLTAYVSKGSAASQQCLFTAHASLIMSSQPPDPDVLSCHAAPWPTVIN